MQHIHGEGTLISQRAHSLTFTSLRRESFTSMNWLKRKVHFHLDGRCGQLLQMSFPGRCGQLLQMSFPGHYEEVQGWGRGITKSIYISFSTEVSSV